jgi:hypothetical protein
MVLWGVLCVAGRYLSHTHPNPREPLGLLAFIFLECTWDQRGKSLTEVPETRARTSRNAHLPVSAWPAFPPRALFSSSSFSERTKELDVQIKYKVRLHN